MFLTASDKCSLKKKSTNYYLITTQSAAPTAFCKIPSNMKSYSVGYSDFSIPVMMRYLKVSGKTFHVPQPKCLCEVPKQETSLTGVQ